MSRTGTGFEVKTRGGCFLGKKYSSTFRKSDFHKGSSKVPLGSRRSSSGPGAGAALGFISKVAIYLSPNSVASSDKRERHPQRLMSTCRAKLQAGTNCSSKRPLCSELHPPSRGYSVLPIRCLDSGNVTFEGNCT